mmetsp:Transcript_37070/g.122861  ORF Transcript_37070/g.122861 Transcript_37070/m.122861 type:complete len:238 (-) Transcript_37070:1092-1805(-)
MTREPLCCRASSARAPQRPSRPRRRRLRPGTRMAADASAWGRRAREPKGCCCGTWVGDQLRLAPVLPGHVLRLEQRGKSGAHPLVEVLDAPKPALNHAQQLLPVPLVEALGAACVAPLKALERCAQDRLLCPRIELERRAAGRQRKQHKSILNARQLPEAVHLDEAPKSVQIRRPGADYHLAAACNKDGQAAELLVDGALRDAGLVEPHPRLAPLALLKLPRPPREAPPLVLGRIGP